MGEIETDMKQYLTDTLKSLDMNILAMEVMPDHIHLLVDCKPQLRLSDAIKILKTDCNVPQDIKDKVFEKKQKIILEHYAKEDDKDFFAIRKRLLENDKEYYERLDNEEEFDKAFDLFNNNDNVNP